MDAEVLLIGGGPAGLTLAIELGRRGIRTALIEERPGTSPYAAANATQARTMEHFRRLGFADEIRAQGLPPDHPTDVAYFTRFARHELARLALPSARDAAARVRGLAGSWSAAELPHRCSQLFVERVLHRHAGALPSVALHHGWRALSVAQDAEGVTVEAKRLADGARATHRARYLVGCDGPRSLTRRTALGAAYAGEGGAVRDFLGGRMHAMYFRAPDLHHRIPHPRAWMYWAFNPERRGFMAAIDGAERFVFHTQLRPGQDESAIDDAAAHRMFEQALGAPCPVEILSRASWTAGLALVAERFADRRVFLAGDAAHLFTPTGGLGYNTAVEDAASLGWKLAALCRGWGGPALPASHEAERRPVALRNTGYARGFADSIGGVVPAPEIEDDTPEGAAARAAAGAYLDRHARAEFDIPGVTFGARYDGSPLIAPDGTAPPPDAANRYEPSACPGGRAPHLWLADGRSLFDSFDPLGFTLLRLGHEPPDAAPFVAAAQARGVPLVVVDRPEAEARDLYAADLALIRPDQVVAWRGSTAAAADAVLARATGWEWHSAVPTGARVGG